MIDPDSWRVWDQVRVWARGWPWLLGALALVASWVSWGAWQEYRAQPRWISTGSLTVGESVGPMAVPVARLESRALAQEIHAGLDEQIRAVEPRQSPGSRLLLITASSHDGARPAVLWTHAVEALEGWLIRLTLRHARQLERDLQDALERQDLPRAERRAQELAALLLPRLTVIDPPSAPQAAARSWSLGHYALPLAGALGATLLGLSLAAWVRAEQAQEQGLSWRATLFPLPAQPLRLASPHSVPVPSVPDIPFEKVPLGQRSPLTDAGSPLASSPHVWIP